MRKIWVAVGILSLCLNAALGFMVVRSHLTRSHLPNTHNGALLVEYDWCEVSGETREKPDSVTFIVGEQLSQTGNEHRLVQYTFPYRSCRHDPTLPMSSFFVTNGTVFCSNDLSFDRSMPGSL